MRVLSVAFPFAPVRPDVPGGAEQVLLTLDKALTKAGHKSIVVAQEGSQVSGVLFPVPAAKEEIDESVRKKTHAECRSIIKEALERTGTDIVHMHGLDFYEYMPDGMPVLVTLHLPLSWYPEQVIRAERHGPFFNCVSSSQARTALRGAGPFIHVENGVDLEGYTVKSAGRYALSMGRICPEKGFHLAIEAAARSGVPFVLAGAVFGYSSHTEYFRETIEPRLGADCEFVGQKGPSERRRLLSEALCLVAPSLVPETSSLCAMEALASGTPVVAFPKGALADIVENGKTGFLVNSVEEMSEAIRASAKIEPGACMEAAKKRFSSKVMIGKYLETYGKILGRRT